MSALLEMRSITKTFPGVKALDSVSLAVEEGEIHALVGENGAGKSTLMKVLSGVYPHGTYGGEIVYEGKEVEFKGIKSSERAGIVIIHQELALIPELSITENIFLGNEVVAGGLVDWQEERRRTIELMTRVGLSLDPDTPIKTLGVGHQQLVEIAKALSKDVKLLILDEPTSALNEDDSENLLNLMLELKAKGITCLMISHKLNEIAAVSDAVTVIRDGKTVETYPVEAGSVDEDRIIRSMVGRSLENRYPEHVPTIGEEILEVRDWRVEHPALPGRMICNDSSFFVRRGEIVGFAGLMGAGRTELARSIFGRSYGHFISGRVLLRGEEVTMTSPASAIRHGLAYVPEDRKNLGLNLLDTIRVTTVAANLRGVVRRGLIDDAMEFQVAEGYRKSMRTKASSVNAGVTTLSGGNQQKVVLAKWMFPDPDVLILDEPTRGIDVGAKYEIYRLIQELSDEGKGVVMISSELPELLGMTHRIYTICEGRITGVVNTAETNQEQLMRMMTTTASAAR
jgi:putative multiple sugar transport system ATP-binding protein